MVFMMADEFLDFLGKQCDQCKFLFQTTEVHTMAVCKKYQQLCLDNSVSHYEFRFLRSQMVEGGLHLRSQSEVDSALSSDVEPKEIKRRKKRKRNSSAVDSGVKLDSNGSDDSWSDSHPVDQEKGLYFQHRLS